MVNDMNFDEVRQKAYLLPILTVIFAESLLRSWQRRTCNKWARYSHAAVRLVIQLKRQKDREFKLVLGLSLTCVRAESEGTPQSTYLCYTTYKSAQCRYRQAAYACM